MNKSFELRIIDINHTDISTDEIDDRVVYCQRISAERVVVNDSGVYFENDELSIDLSPVNRRKMGAVMFKGPNKEGIEIIEMYTTLRGETL